MVEAFLCDSRFAREIVSVSNAARTHRGRSGRRGAATHHGDAPIPATRRLPARAGQSAGDIDVIALNETFAAQALAVMRVLGPAVDAGHLNLNGGATALGHPLGMSGARPALTAGLDLERRRGRFAVATMGIGVGQGISLLLEMAT